MHTRTRKLLVMLAGAALGCAAGTTIAAEGYFLKDAPVSRMTKEDFAIANPVIRKALDEGQAGEAYAWNNPATAASGEITLRSAPFESRGTTCRRAQFSVSAGGLKNVSAWTLCKMPDGWKAVDE